jgi:hypothetical protein
LPAATDDEAWNVTEAPLLGTESGNVVVVVKPDGKEDKVTVGVTEALVAAVIVTVKELLGKALTGFGETTMDRLAGLPPPGLPPRAVPPPPQEETHAAKKTARGQARREGRIPRERTGGFIVEHQKGYVVSEDRDIRGQLLTNVNTMVVALEEKTLPLDARSHPKNLSPYLANIIDI